LKQPKKQKKQKKTNNSKIQKIYKNTLRYKNLFTNTKKNNKKRHFHSFVDLIFVLKINLK